MSSLNRVAHPSVAPPVNTSMGSPGARLCQALGLTVRYRRIGTTEEVKLTSTLRGVDLARVGGNHGCGTSQVTSPRGVDLERVGGPTCPGIRLAARPLVTALTLKA